MNIVVYHRARLVIGCGLQIAHCSPEMAGSMHSTLVFQYTPVFSLMKLVVVEGINALGWSVFSHTYA